MHCRHFQWLFLNCCRRCYRKYHKG